MASGAHCDAKGKFVVSDRWNDPGVLRGAVSGADAFSLPAVGAAAGSFEVEYLAAGEGVSEISYATGPGDADGVVVEGPRLPWRTSVRMTGAEAVPVLSVTPAEDGGRIESVIRVDGLEAMRSTAAGASGTAVCIAEPGGDWRRLRRAAERGGGRARPVTGGGPNSACLTRSRGRSSGCDRRCGAVPGVSAAEVDLSGWSSPAAGRPPSAGAPGRSPVP